MAIKTPKNIAEDKTAPETTMNTPAENTALEVSKPSEAELKKAAKKNAKKVARKVLVSFVNSADLKGFSLPEDIIAALKATFTASTRGGGSSGGTSLADKLFAAFHGLEIGAGLDELEIFKQFKIGRGEMRKKVRSMIRDAAPEMRLWIVFDEAKELWVLQGRGAKAPAGWKGYLPVEGGDLN